MKRQMHFFGLLSFMFLMFIKVSALHTYTHHQDEDHKVEECASCELAIENQLSEALLDFSIEIVFQQFTPFEEPLSLQELNIAKRTTPNLHLFLRPPPPAS